MRTDTWIMPAGNGEYKLSVKANGGSVKVEKPMGSGSSLTWVGSSDDVFTSDGNYWLNLGQTETRFTPAGGAAYEVTK